MPHRIPYRLCVVMLGACFFSAAVSAQTAHQIVRVTDAEAKSPIEVCVAINPTKPDHIVAVSFQAGVKGEPRFSNYYYVSDDAGRSWKTVKAANPDRRIQGDDVLTFGPDGTVHHTYISFDGLRQPKPKRARTGIYHS